LEVVTAIRTHSINADIIKGLNGEIGITQQREQDLINETRDLREKNDKLSRTVSNQDTTLKSLNDRADAFDHSAVALRTRFDASLAALKRDEANLERAQSDAAESSGKAAKAAELARKTASDMTSTLDAERAMQEGMRELITPRVLTPEQIETLKEQLKVFPKIPFDMSVADDKDAKDFVTQLAKLLPDAGWIWKPAASMGSQFAMNWDRPDVPILTLQGIRLEISESARPALEKAAVALINGLAAANIKVLPSVIADENFRKDVDKNTVHLFIGKR
jgi:ABC-type transporter Mla subunit MlaD